MVCVDVKPHGYLLDNQGSKDATRTQHQRSELPTVVPTWHSSKLYKVQKLHQRHVLELSLAGVITTSIRPLRHSESLTITLLPVPALYITASPSQLHYSQSQIVIIITASPSPLHCSKLSARYIIAGTSPLFYSQSKPVAL